jgi:predicted outer membrane protein
MKRTVTIVAAAALATLVFAPAGTAAPESPKPKQVASQMCHEEKREIGNKAFKEEHGKHAMQTCKRQHEDEEEPLPTA